MKTHLKAITLIASVLALTACGGGGSESVPKKQPQQVDAPLEITASQTSFSIDEGTNQTVTVSHTGANGNVTLSVSDAALPEWISFTGGTGDSLSINVADLQNEESVSFVLTAKDGKDTDTVTLTVNANNTSVKPILAELAAYQLAVPNYIKQSEELRFAERALELASMMDPEVTPSIKAQLMSTLQNAAQGPLSEALLYASQQGVNDDYAAGTKDEQAVIAALDIIKAETKAFTTGLDEIISTIVATVPGGLMAPDTSTAYLVPETLNLSRFVGNPELGEFDEAGSWFFNTEYAYLRAIVEPSLLTCNAQ